MKKNSKLTTAPGRSGDRLFRLIIVLLALILVILVVATVVRINNSFSYYVTEPNDLLRAIKNGYYTDAVSEMYDNIALGETVEKNEDYRISYALINYYEAESCYAAYERASVQASGPEAGELKEKAAEYLAKMDAARADMGELEFMAADIDKIFEN